VVYSYAHTEQSGMMRRSCLKMSALSSSVPWLSYDGPWRAAPDTVFSSLDSMSSCVPGMMCLPSGALISCDMVFVFDIARPDAVVRWELR